LLKQESIHEEWQTIQWPNEATTKRQTRIYKTLHTEAGVVTIIVCITYITYK